ncbi:hypothetical protein VNO77_03784 [Canavalia gladiata]|uniref:Uncharacterized protein n=1 Tax=Canavalia gladiata TaxID=3824 RepID=A0AAN9N0G7_CANGL
MEVVAKVVEAMVVAETGSGWLFVPSYMKGSLPHSTWLNPLCMAFMALTWFLSMERLGKALKHELFLPRLLP